jgi:Zn-dependent peptidase ImmA (M78 family)
MRVPYLSKNKIARSVNMTLAQFMEKTGQTVEPPIPIEDILSMMGLRCIFFDFEQIGTPDVLGATYVKKKLVAINADLLDDRSKGRAAFTMAHEAGHWVLHRNLLAIANRHGNMEEAIFCRAQDARKPIEWQADYFASCLLMPEDMVRSAFKNTFEPDVIDIVNVEKDFVSLPFCFDFSVDNWPFIADAVRTTGGFENVSRQAMIIRLQELGLVVNHTRQKIGWTKGSQAVPAV